MRVLDNLRSHKVAGVEAAILARGARVRFLPPDSQDLNPIEKLFSKLKARLRKATARDMETLWRKSGNYLTPFRERMHELLQLLRICEHLNRKSALA